MNDASYNRLKAKYVGLLGSKCRKCGAEFFPQARVCRKCGSFELQDVPMPPTGKVTSYTILNVPALEFKDDAPLVIGYIELSNGVRLIAQLADISPSEVREGMLVRMEARPLSEKSAAGDPKVGYKFVKSEK